VFLISHIYATCPTHLILLIHHNDKWCLVSSTNHRSSTICNFLQPSDPSFLLGPNIFLFSNTFSLYSSLNVRDRLATSLCNSSPYQQWIIKNFWQCSQWPVIIVQELRLACRPEFAPRSRQMFCISHKVC
jgi:hypothetical protein